MRKSLAAAFATTLFTAAAMASGPAFWPTQPLADADPAFPSNVLAALDMQLPEPPDASAPQWCFAPGHHERRTISYCVCYDREGCAQLKDGDLCAGPLGTIAKGTATACRQREATVLPLQKL